MFGLFLYVRSQMPSLTQGQAPSGASDDTQPVPFPRQHANLAFVDTVGNA
jgi:hypothetical protein